MAMTKAEKAKMEELERTIARMAAMAANPEVPSTLPANPSYPHKVRGWHFNEHWMLSGGSIRDIGESTRLGEFATGAYCSQADALLALRAVVWGVFADRLVVIDRAIQAAREGKS